MQDQRGGLEGAVRSGLCGLGRHPLLAGKLDLKWVLGFGRLPDALPCQCAFVSVHVCDFFMLKRSQLYISCQVILHGF